MEVLKLIAGIAFIVLFTWLLVRNQRRTGLIHAIFRFDTIVGIIAGFYLTITALLALVS